MKTVEVKMITHYRDNGDGSSTTYLYNNMDELKSKNGYGDEFMKALIEGEDPYENGSLDNTTITVVVHDDGSVELEPFSVYSGNQ